MSNHYPTHESFSRILQCLACPQCGTELRRADGVLQCGFCETSYPFSANVFDLRPSTRRETDETAWSQHWSDENQQILSQRFFSFYRKAVFSRTVQFFIERYFPPSGMFVEAGSGTSETSLRINKHGGARMLVATDVVLPVLKRCHPVMDVRVCGDIFCFPFRANSIDGIWNVGVMEHFTHAEIDQILRGFHRVLKPGGRVILLWPGSNSVPQKILRVVEKIINLRARQEPFHFHPDEISQLRSLREGREVLLRNGFQPLHLDTGLRSLLAFKILVGVKS